jgi:phosphoribosylanthranilate isomerase
VTTIKICGVTTLDDALLCATAGAHILGLNFYPPSPRYVAPEKARAITDALRRALGEACPLLVGVFANASTHEIAKIIQVVGLDAAQLSGDETPDALAGLGGRGFKAIRPRSRDEALELVGRFHLDHLPGDGRLPSLLVDAYHKDLYGGTGEQASIDVALAAKEIAPRLMLAGGLTPENVAGRVRAIQPWGVDVASGVERTPGVKEAARVRAFIAAVRALEG